MTDRALRYRANACPPAGDQICSLCGSTQNVEIGHINGREEDSSQANLFWTCRSCNVRCANTLRRAGLGRLTAQFNQAASGQSGARTLSQWLQAVFTIKGESDAMDVAAAVDMIRATPPERRSRFGKEIWSIRRRHFGRLGHGRIT